MALVHNGIIENFRELRAELTAKGHKFESETDTEVAVHLVTDYLDRGFAPADAAMEAVRRLTGAYALAMIFAGEESLLVGARKGSPLAVGYSADEAYLGSDAFALAPFTNRLSYLEDGDVAVLRGADVTIYDIEGRIANREIKIANASAGLVDKGGYRHFMAKEIHEQPEVIGHTLAHYIDIAGPSIAVREKGAVEALRKSHAPHHLCLRHGLLCGPDRQILVRENRAHRGGSRCGERIALSRSGVSQGRRGPVHLAIGRNRRHAGRTSRCEGARTNHHRHRQRAGKFHRARCRYRAATLSPVPKSAWPRPRPSPVN